MSSINSHQFAQMFKDVFGASKITKVEANANGLDASEVEGSFVDADIAYSDKDMQEYVIAQFNADLEELDEIPEDDDDEIKPASEGSKAGS